MNIFNSKKRPNYKRLAKEFCDISRKLEGRPGNDYLDLMQRRSDITKIYYSNIDPDVEKTRVNRLGEVVQKHALSQTMHIKQ